MSIGIVLAGLGQIGMGYDRALDPARFVTTHARAFSQHPEFHLEAGVDSNPDLRQEFEATYGCVSYPDIESACAAHAADVAVVALPTEFHAEALERILRCAQWRAVLCEKPLAYGVEDAKHMVRSCADNNVSLFVNYMRRSDPGVMEVKRRINAGLIQSPMKGRVWYTKGWLHNGSHFFNLLEYWLGPLMEFKVLKKQCLEDENFSDLDVWVAFERGEITFLAASADAFSHFEIELFSPSGRLWYGSETDHVNWQSMEPNERFKNYTSLSGDVEEISMTRERYQLQVVDQLALSLNGQAAQLCTGADALKTLISMHKVLESTI